MSTQEVILRNPMTALTLKGQELTVDDLRDPINEPTAYNKTRRGLTKAVDAVKAAWTETTTMYQVMEILRVYGVRTHSYCRRD